MFFKKSKRIKELEIQTAELQVQLSLLIGSQEILNKRMNDINNDIQFIKEKILVGVDHHTKYSESFAVICIKGNIDYVNFFRLKPNQIKEISMFLKRFESNNVAIDTMPCMKDLFIR